MKIERSARSIGIRAKRRWLAVAMLFLAAPAYSADSDDGAIRALEAAQEAAWNGHDAHAYAALFAPDASLVTSRGAVLRGGEIESRSARDFATIFAASRMRLGDVVVRPLGADAALARVSWSISGVRSPNGETLRGRRIVQTQALVRTGDSWRIAGLQDTVMLDDDQAAPEAAATVASPTAVPAVTKPPRRCVVGRANGQCLIYGKN